MLLDSNDKQFYHCPDDVYVGSLDIDSSFNYHELNRLFKEIDLDGHLCSKTIEALSVYMDYMQYFCCYCYSFIPNRYHVFRIQESFYFRPDPMPLMLTHYLGNVEHMSSTRTYSIYATFISWEISKREFERLDALEFWNAGFSKIKRLLNTGGKTAIGVSSTSPRW